MSCPVWFVSCGSVSRHRPLKESPGIPKNGFEEELEKPIYLSIISAGQSLT